MQGRKERRHPGRPSIITNHVTLPGSFANELAHAIAQSGVQLGETNDQGFVLTPEHGRFVDAEDGYYVLVPANEDDYSPIYVPVSAETSSTTHLTVKGDLPRMVDQKVVRSSDGEYKTAMGWNYEQCAFVGATTPTDDIVFNDENGQQMAAEDLVGYETVAVGGKESVFTFAVTFTVPSTLSSSDILQLDVVAELPEGLEYVEGSHCIDLRDGDKTGTTASYDEATRQLRVGMYGRVRNVIDNGKSLIQDQPDRTFTLFYNAKLTDQATFGTNAPNTVPAHLEYNFTGANPQPDGEGGYVGDAETASASASVVTYQAKVAFVEANGFNKDDRSTWTPVEDLPYPEDDDRGIIDGYKDQHAEVDFGGGTYGATTGIKFEKRDDAGWFTYDGVGPTVGAEHKGSYEPDPYALLIWPAPYLYTHPAEYHGVKDPALAFYNFHLSSNLNEDSTEVASLALEYCTEKQYENQDWGKEPAVFTDVETGVVEIVVPLHRRDYTELPLTGMTPDRVLPFVCLALVVVGSGALALYRRKTAQKAA